MDGSVLKRRRYLFKRFFVLDENLSVPKGLQFSVV